jgi:hypothetical protein
MEWQPMESAPKDGTFVILKTKGPIVKVLGRGHQLPSDERNSYFCDAYEAWLSSGHWMDQDFEFGDDSAEIICNPIGWKLDE